VSDAAGVSPAIRVENVSKRYRLYKERSSSIKEAITRRSVARYDEFWALKDVSLEIQPGTVYGLVGHNGSGKSTLLRMMAGIQRPEQGKVAINGRVSALLELGAGFHPELSGRENIYLNASILGLKKREIDAMYDEIVDFSGLAEFVDTPVKVYSSGMYVRLGFSVAVHVHPEILIIDEVIAVGDEEFQRRCFEHLYKLRNQGVTIVMVTHSLGLVQSMCDHAAWLDHGTVMATGKSGDVVHQYLDAVNVQETDRFEAEAEAASAAHHSGGPTESGLSTLRPVTIEHVEFLGEDDQPVHTTVPLTPLRIRVHFRCHEPIEKPLFSFAVENANNVLVANPGIQPDRQPGDHFVGDGYVDYRMDRLSLGPGKYTFTFAAHDTDGMTIFDKRERVDVLLVQPGPDIVMGVVDLLGSWEPLNGATKEHG
jgi:ABC-type polysaccharide/polyol phosphate transport system ATPase subunit